MRKTLTAAVAALLVLGGATSAQAAEQPAEATVWQAWIMPTDGTDWPQLEATEENLAAIPCGTTVRIQNDEYVPVERDRYVADGVLNEGEDYGSDTQRGAISWHFTEHTAPDCEVAAPIAQVIAPQITPAVGSCVDGVWSQTTATATLGSNGNGFWTTETRWDADRLDEGVAYAILGEQTYYFTSREGAVLSEDLAGGYLTENGWISFTVTANAVDIEDCTVTTPSVPVTDASPQTPATQPVSAATPSHGGTVPAAATTRDLAVTGAEDVSPELIWVAALTMLGGALLFRRHLTTTK